MKSILTSAYTTGQRYYLQAGGGTDKVPEVTRNAPAELSDAVGTVLGIAGWAGTAAGVAGIIITGVMMAVSMKQGQGSSEHMSRLGMVLGGCILVATAGPIVAFFFDDQAGGQ